jgi:AcrR family transcriptional regulator
MAKQRDTSRKHELDTRSRILEAAYALLIKRGGGELSMAEIGRGANVSRQAVYLHFADRADLFVALVQYVDEKHGLAEALEKIRNAPSGVASLRAMALHQARTNPDVWPLARAADAVGRTDDGVEKAWQDRLRDRYSACKQIVKRLARDGTLREDLEADVATDLLWTITSLDTWEDLVLLRKWKSGQYENQITDLLMRSLTRKR